MAEYLPRCEVLARRLVNANHSGAEFDDLVQEGLIFVWQSLSRGIKPRTEFIRGRMLNWVRFLNRHDALSYDEVCDQWETEHLGVE